MVSSKVLQVQLQRMPVQLLPTAVAATPQKRQLTAVRVSQQLPSLHPPVQPCSAQGASSRHGQFRQVLAQAKLARGRGSLFGWQ